MDKPNFIPGQSVIWNLERLNQSTFDKYFLKKYGKGPFEIVSTNELPSNNVWANEHPQWLRIKTPAGEIETSGAFLLPA